MEYLYSNPTDTLTLTYLGVSLIVSVYLLGYLKGTVEMSSPLVGSYPKETSPITVRSSITGKH